MERRGGTVSKTRYTIHLADALVWMDSREAQSVHAVVTDPPYGFKEYTEIEQRKLRNATSIPTSRSNSQLSRRAVRALGPFSLTTQCRGVPLAQRQIARRQTRARGITALFCCPAATPT
jgi:hypothetical protein